MLPKYQAQRRALMKQGEPPADPRLQRRPAPPPNAPAPAFRPQIRGSLLDALQRMAEQSGRDPNELLDELISTATSNDSPPSMEGEEDQDDANAPPPPATTSPTPNANGAGRWAVAPGGKRMWIATPPPPRDPNMPPIGESIAAQKRRESGGEDRDDASASDDDAPPEQMKGSRPNPLRPPSAADWARKGDDASPAFAGSKKTEDDERERRRQKYLAPAGKAQGRG